MHDARTLSQVSPQDAADKRENIVIDTTATPIRYLSDALDPGISMRFT